MMNQRPATRTYRRALITGASSGIGRAIVEALPAGTSLLLSGRDSDGLARLATELAGRGRIVEIVAADLSNDAGRDGVAAAGERFEVDLFVCNAGQGPYGAFADTEEAVLRAAVEVNVVAPLLLLRRLLPVMIARARADGMRAGVIVTSSEVGFFPVPYLATYAASKAFDLSLAEALAAEHARDPVDILALCPTATRTGFASRSGFGGNLPGAQSPATVARAALGALGRQRTLAVGPISGGVLAVPALVRAGIAQAIALALRRTVRSGDAQM